MRKLSTLLISVLILFSALGPVQASETLSDDIVILYTNDVHTYIDGALSYDVIAAVKKELQKVYKHVILADAGDHIQGTAYGSMDKGENIIKLMNAARYDVATLGNHEFDYTMTGCINVINWAEFPYISCNFYHESNGSRLENVLDSYVIFDCGDEKIAFVGITTPETFSKSTPAYFQDENGNFIYGISAGDDGSLMQKDVQKAIDSAKKDGATKIIALGHLGVDPSSQSWTSKKTIAGVQGLDAFIDGHSHTVMEGETVKDKAGHDVLLTQTGEYFGKIGMMHIDAETDKITTDFIGYEEILADDGKTVTGVKLVSELYSNTELITDASVKEIKDAWLKQTDEKLGQKIGSTDLVFDNYDADGNRLVRSSETNSGDFASDALYYLFDNMGLAVDVAIMNGGGIRNKAISGDITYKTCKDMHTFGNVACLQTVSGRQLLDALEWGARKLGIGENGGFLHVSGLTYKVDTSVPNTVKENDMEIWLGAPDSYRVYDVRIYNRETSAYEALDTEKNYNLAGYNYTLRDLGDGYAMFNGAVNVLDYVMEDYMVLANYIQGFENGVIDTKNSPLLTKHPGLLIDYSTVNGSGRIEIADKAAFDDEVWVGGIKVTAENAADVFGDGGSVKYDSKTDTLTLTDATIINENGHGIYSVGINLTVNGIDTAAKGSNDISGKSITESGIDEYGDAYTAQTSGHGIFSEGDGYSGNGGLKLTGTIGNITAENGNGIYAYEDIVIAGIVGDISGTGGISSGISSDFGSVIIEETGNIQSISSEEWNGISSAGDVVIAGAIDRILGNGYAGIHVTGGNLKISGNIQNINGFISGIEVYTAHSLDEPYGGSAEINGNVGNISGGTIGIYTDSDLNISGSANVFATNDADNTRHALHTGENIILPDGENIITEPVDYKINSVSDGVIQDENGTVETFYTTVCDNNGNPALNVKFSGWSNPFTDVSASGWYYSDIKYVAVNGLMKGISETDFAPGSNLTRAMLITILYRMENEPAAESSAPFTDAESGKWYENAIIWAKQNGIVNGISETEFAPDSNITREQLATTMHRYAQYKGFDVTAGENTNILSYDDFPQISEYAIAPLQYAAGSGLIKGKTESTLNPLDCATRAETAAILHRFIKSVK